MVPPTCHRCGRTMRGAPLSSSIAPGATVFGGGASLMLYNGVVCQSCGNVECIDCKSVARQMEPCSWCGGAVVPAYEHLIGRHGTVAQPAGRRDPRVSAETRRGLGWGDLFAAPLRFFLLTFVLVLSLVWTVAAAWGICSLTVAAPAAGPFFDRVDCIYWVESHTAPVTSLVLAWTAWATGLVLCVLCVWRFEWPARIVEFIFRDSGKKPVEPGAAFSRIEVAAYRVLFAAAGVFLLTLPLWVSFASLTAEPAADICTLNAEGMHLVGRTAELDERGDPKFQEGEPTSRSVPWNKVAAIAFTPTLQPHHDAISWTDAAGNKAVLLIEKHVSFVREDASRAGWKKAVERFAPHVKFASDPETTPPPRNATGGHGEPAASGSAPSAEVPETAP